MTTKDIARLIYEIVGAEKLNDKQKEMIVTILELVQLQKSQSAPATPGTAQVVTEEPNSYKSDPNEVPLNEITNFTMPNEVNLQFEGEEEAKKVILKPTPLVS